MIYIYIFNVAGEWKKLQNEELNDLYSLPNIVRVVKSRRVRWAGHGARMGEEKGVHRWIFRKLEGVVETEWSWLRIGTGGGHLYVP
jgi:hypothetical protein